jgi:hypothetical protein
MPGSRSKAWSAREPARGGGRLARHAGGRPSCS